MGLLEKLKSALGLDDPSRSDAGTGPPDAADRAEPGHDEGARVTVEHDPATASESAVKGTDVDGAASDEDDGATDSAAGGDGAGDGEPATAGTDTDERADTDADEAAGTDTNEAAGTDTDEAAGTDTDEAAGTDAGASAAGDTAEPESAVPPERVDESTETITGIGPAYSERLAGAGVETVGDLAAADADALAEETGISEKRIAGWIDSAREA